MEISEEVLKFFDRKDVQDALVRNSMKTLYELTKNLPNLVIGEITSILMQAGVDPLQGMSVIPTYFLYGQEDIKELNIPSSITIINGSAFDSSGLESIVIPDSVKEVRNRAFVFCGNLKSVNLPIGVKLGAQAFAFAGLESVELDSARLQDWLIFSDCPQLKSVIIKGDTPKIPPLTFENCEKLTHVELPISLKEIEPDSFHGCSKLEEINYAGTMSQWRDIEIESPNARLFSCEIICSDGTLRYDKEEDEWIEV